MSASRKANDPILVNLLKESFKDKVIMSRCRASSQRQLKQKITTRVFSEFPSLLPKTELQSQSVWLTLVMTDVSSHQLDDSEDLRVLSNRNKKVLASNIKSLAMAGCDRLLANSKVNEDIVALLGWQAYQDEINICDLLSAYTGEVLLDIVKNVCDNNKIEPTACNAITDFISKHYREWVIEAIHESGHVYEEKNSHDQHTRRSQNAFAIGLGALAAAAGSAALFAAIGIGYGLFAASRDSSSSRPSTPKPDHDHPDIDYSRFLY